MVIGFVITGGPRRSPSRSVAVETRRVDRRVNLGRALREQVEHRRWDPGKAPVTEATRRPWVGLDRVPEPDGFLRGGEAPDHRRSVDQVAEPAGVERLPPALHVEHLREVGDQHVVVRLRVSGTSGEVSSPRPQQTRRRGPGLCSASATTLATEPRIEEGERGVRLGVDDGVHGVDLTKHTQHGNRLVRRHHQLHTRPTGPHHPLTEVGVDHTAGTEHRVVAVVGDPPSKPEPTSEASTPLQRRLTPAAVVTERCARVVVGTAEHVLPVVLDRVHPHHPKPRHRNLQWDTNPKGLQSCCPPFGSRAIFRGWSRPSRWPGSGRCSRSPMGIRGRHPVGSGCGRPWWLSGSVSRCGYGGHPPNFLGPEARESGPNAAYRSGRSNESRRAPRSIGSLSGLVDRPRHCLRRSQP